jgi:hypothetical protein
MTRACEAYGMGVKSVKGPWKPNREPLSTYEKLLKDDRFVSPDTGHVLGVKYKVRPSTLVAADIPLSPLFTHLVPLCAPSVYPL